MASQETVFISSVSHGMEPYRAAVRSAVESLDGYHCVNMENFGARDSSSYSTCLAKVAECTLFVGIVGPGYGSIHPAQGKSYSELEYDRAVELDRRRLMFMAEDDFPVQAHLIESDALRQRQQAFRERVGQDRQVSFFNDRDELGRLVLQAIHNCKTDLASKISRGISGGAGTRLLFPYVTSQGGFDTGIAISNVSLDFAGLAPSKGAAKLKFYGANAPAPSWTSTIPAGDVIGLLASAVAPNFNGYLVVDCSFRPARGFAFISDIGARNLAAGYLAEVLEVG